MIELIDGLPENVIGAEASGRVSAEDYDEILIPAVQRLLDASDGRARVLFLLGDDFEGYEPEAALDDARMGLHHWSDFEKIAVVTDHSVYRTLIKGFGFLMPGEVKVYPLAEIDDAKSWVSN